MSDTDAVCNDYGYDTNKNFHYDLEYLLPDYYPEIFCEYFMPILQLLLLLLLHKYHFIIYLDKVSCVIDF